MSPRLPRVTAPELLRALLKDGWFVARHSGSHAILRHATKPGRVVVAKHPGAIVKPKTLQDALDDAGLTAEELRDLL